MKDLVQQTKQAFYFSVGFYVLAFSLKLIKFPMADVLVSIALFLSLIWVVLVLREIMLSTKIGNLERLLLMVFIILGNIVAGAVYFLFIRDKVLRKVQNKN